MKIKSLLILFCLALSAIVVAQEVPATPTPAVTLGDQVTMKIGGFARADAFFDSRKNADALDGLLFLIPSNKTIDSTSAANDINAVKPLRMSAAASRLNAKFSGPDVLNAKTSSLIEFDFTGYNGIGLRFRHAWVKLNWQTSELLMGRFWHPMFILDAFPTVLALNTGAPFCVFNRTEQIRFTQKIGTSLSIMAAASAQMDYSFPATHNQLIPDLTANIQYKNDMLTIGASANLKENQPQLSVTGKKGKVYQTDAKISSISAEAYAMIKVGALKIKGSALYGENMHELLMLGGYAVKSRDTALTNIEQYTPVKILSTWGNVTYGEQLQANLFIGYSKNLGTADKDIFVPKSGSPYVGRGSDIASLLRISPSVSYKVGRVQFWLELEHTVAAFGKNDAADYGKVKDTKSIANTRVQLASIFYF